MWKLPVAATVVLACVCHETFAQDRGKIDFGRDVQPILKAHCIECHGPKQQKNGFRLDRRLRGCGDGRMRPLMFSGDMGCFSPLPA